MKRANTGPAGHFPRIARLFAGPAHSHSSVVFLSFLYTILKAVIPAKAGTGYLKNISGFRVKPGMTICKPFIETLQ
jgi:hypothetical protein